MCFAAGLHHLDVSVQLGHERRKRGMGHVAVSLHEKDEQDDAPAFFDAFCRLATTASDMTVARPLVKQRIDPPACLASRRDEKMNL